MLYGKKTKKPNQQQFKKKKCLNVDKPKIGGSGSSNDENTGCVFFCCELPTNIMGIKSTFIFNVLSVLSSGHNINVVRFKIYALETAKRVD